MQRPRVSIGLPVYNGQRYLEAALRSLVTQSYADFELIISDNCSTDRTPEICQDLAASDARIRYSRNERNLGANPNFNRVLDLARGEYFRWAAYDDICLPHYLDKCVAALDANPGAVLAHTQTLIIDESGRVIDTDPGSLANLGLEPHEIDDPHRELDSPSPVTRFAEIVLRTKWCFEIFALMRTQMLRDVGGLGPFYGSDKVALAYMALHGIFSEIPEPLFLRRHHAQQSSLIKTAKEREAWSGVPKPKPLASQTHCLGGYASAVSRSDLTTGEWLRCWGVIARYLLQWDKWTKALGIQPHKHVDVSTHHAEIPKMGRPSVR